MAKGWKTVGTINKLENDVKINVRQRDWVLRNTPVQKNLMSLYKEGVDLYEKRKTQEESLVKAYDDKRLKSKQIIKKAIEMKTGKRAEEHFKK